MSKPTLSGGYRQHLDRQCRRVGMVVCFAPAFAGIFRAPFDILMPIIVFVCAIGAYAVNNRMIDIWYMIIFGIIGMAFKKLEYPIAPMVLALVLGDMAENAMRQSLVMSQGSPLIFFSWPIAGIVNSLAVIFFFWPVIQMARERIFGPWKTAEKADQNSEIGRGDPDSLREPVKAGTRWPTRGRARNRPAPAQRGGGNRCASW